MAGEVIKWINQKVGRLGQGRRHREVQQLLPFNTQPESLIPQIQTVLQPITAGGMRTIGPQGFSRLSDVTLRNYFSEQLGQTVQKAQNLQQTDFLESEKSIGLDWEIHRNMFGPPVLQVQEDVFFPNLRSCQKHWGLNYMVVNTEELVHLSGYEEDKMPTQELRFRFIKDAQGAVEFIEVKLNDAMFVLDKTGTMLGADVMREWATAHGWIDNQQAANSFDSVEVFGWQERQDAKSDGPKTIQGPEDMGIQ